MAAVSSGVLGATAGVEWRSPGGAGRLSWDPGTRAPLVIPAGTQGAAVALAIVEALDLAAQSGDPLVTVDRGAVAVWFERGGDWPAPPHPPSEVLRIPAAARAGFGAEGEDDAVERLLEAARRTLGAEGFAALGQFPRRRSQLAEQRRRAERRFFTIEESLRSRRRKAGGFFSIAVAGLAAAGFGALVGAGGVAATGGMVFTLGGLGTAVEAAARRRAEGRREVIREQITAIAREDDELEQELLRITERLSTADPWRLADVIADAEATDSTALAEESGSERRKEIGVRLAGSLGVEAGALAAVWDSTSRCRARVNAWPPEVAMGEEILGAAAIVDGVARLLARVEERLPAPWPIVLWAPWRDAPPEDRARRLMALAEHAPDRPVIAVVET